ncbi:hypothetical protein E4T56_gene18357 [Termitomyces sp. T112]|nr:hypothetical protein C0989_003165 [Termitomyces sp. Mn162]KAG5735989.1 hypothetical protein E4T56_gene18357 [Termitomyces sp. T112]KAH0588546.1 hypothetical protein H2248_004376 [Termitomyces sp. 'cryptogamus']KNZ74025.1 hypothetical protein J132_08335 [Termitomyces sp. J132]
MGQRSKATFSYGFVLDDAEMEDLYDALGFEDTEDIIPLMAWLNSALFEPFCFVAERQYMEGGDEDEAEEGGLVISFVGRYDGKLNKQELEIWGRDIAGTKFKSIPMPAEKEFMVSAKEAFQKLKDSEAFKEAEITEIVPQWILMLSVG